MAKALVPLAKGFEDIEAVAIIDILRRGEVEVTTAAIGPSLDVVSAHGIVMKADALFADVAEDAYDAIVLPGGGEGTVIYKTRIGHVGIYKKLCFRLRSPNRQCRGYKKEQLCTSPETLVTGMD